MAILAARERGRRDAHFFQLRNEILSYWATGLNAVGEQVTPSDFIHKTDTRISELGTITLGFNPETFANPQKIMGSWGNVGAKAQ